MARLLALLVCALAQSNALVVSAHTGAVIRSGVSTPQQQLCRWTAPLPSRHNAARPLAAWIAPRLTLLSSPPRRAQCAGCYGARGADCDGGAQEASEQDEDAPTQSQRAPAHRAPTPADGPRSRKLPFVATRPSAPSSKRSTRDPPTALRSGLPRRGGRHSWRTTVRLA